MPDGRQSREEIEALFAETEPYEGLDGYSFDAQKDPTDSMVEQIDAILKAHDAGEPLPPAPENARVGIPVELQGINPCGAGDLGDDVHQLLEEVFVGEYIRGGFTYGDVRPSGDPINPLPAIQSVEMVRDLLLYGHILIDSETGEHLTPQEDLQLYRSNVNGMRYRKREGRQWSSWRPVTRLTPRDFPSDVVEGWRNSILLTEPNTEAGVLTEADLREAADHLRQRYDESIEPVDTERGLFQIHVDVAIPENMVIMSSTPHGGRSLFHDLYERFSSGASPPWHVASGYRSWDRGAERRTFAESRGEYPTVYLINVDPSGSE